jgi:phosphoglycolate phosphatase
VEAVQQRGGLRAVVFDFDGTLVDSYSGITATVNHVRAWHHMPPLCEAEVRKHVGRGVVYLLQHTVGSEASEQDVARYRAHHPSVMLQGTHLLPGAAETLQTLKTQGLRLAICSNKPRDFTLQLLSYLKLNPFLDVVLGPEDVAHPKPAPDMLRAALVRLDVTPEEALYVGDMVVDIQTARTAGVHVWVLPTGSNDRATLQQGNPDRLLGELSELPRLLSV